MKEWKWYVYIIMCKDDLYYTGMTWDIADRWEQHLSGLGSRFTNKHRPEEVVYIEEYDDFDAARKREKQIKNWSKKKKRKLIEGKWGQFW